MGRNDAAVRGLLLVSVTAVEASRRWHQTQGYRAQAETSGRVGRLLRETAEVTVGAGVAREHRPRARRTEARTGAARCAEAAFGARPMASVVQQALPRHTRAVLPDGA